MANIKIDFENGDKLHIDGIKESKVDELIEYFKNERADVKVSKVPRLDSGIVEGIKGWQNLKTTLAKAAPEEPSSEQAEAPAEDNHKSDDRQLKRTEYVRDEGEVVHSESNGFTIGDFDLLKAQYESAAPEPEPEAPAAEEMHTDKVPDFYKTGIKETARGKKYRTSYLCPECGDIGKHYVPDWVEEVNCYNCEFRMKIQSVESIMGQSKDAFNNWYVAGKFLPKGEDGKLVNPDLESEEGTSKKIRKIEISNKSLGQIFYEEKENGMMQKDIAQKYNVSAPTVSRLIKSYLESEV